jgi:hypothetical protein
LLGSNPWHTGFADASWQRLALEVMDDNLFWISSYLRIFL